MRTRKLWVAALALSLWSVPAWASRSDDRAADGRKQKPSIQLTKAKHGERAIPSPSVLSSSVMDDVQKQGRIHEKKPSPLHTSGYGLPPGLVKKWHLGTPGNARANGRGKAHERSKRGRGPRGLPGPTGGVPAPNGEPGAPIPEPSALLFFGMGLLITQRALGVTWR